MKPNVSSKVMSLVLHLCERCKTPVTRICCIGLLEFLSGIETVRLVFFVTMIESLIGEISYVVISQKDRRLSVLYDNGSLIGEV